MMLRKVLMDPERRIAKHVMTGMDGMDVAFEVMSSGEGALA